MTGLQNLKRTVRVESKVKFLRGKICKLFLSSFFRDKQGFHRCLKLEKGVALTSLS